MLRGYLDHVTSSPFQPLVHQRTARKGIAKRRRPVFLPLFKDYPNTNIMATDIGYLGTLITPLMYGSRSYASTALGNAHIQQV